MLRFAPSPTADMHIGDLRVAIINYMVAQQKGVNFIVRIEDTDKEKNITGKDTEIMEILEKFALTHDRVSHQSENLHMHQTLAIRLLEENKAFICTCTDEQLKIDEETTKSDKYSGRCTHIETHKLAKYKEDKIPFVIRIKAPEMSTDIDDFIILNADGTPTYNFACACDDMISGVNMIIQDKGNHTNTVKQEHIKTLLGYEQSTDYVNLPIILDSDEITIQYLFEQGFIPNAIINYTITLGLKTPVEIFTMPEALEWFDITHIADKAIDFDIEKLRTINRAHLALIEDKTISSLFGFADEDIGKLAKLYLEEASTINELALKIRPIFAPKDFSGEHGEQKKILSNVIFNSPMIHSFEDFCIYLTKETGLEGESLSKPLRSLLTGANSGPELSSIYTYIKSYLLEVAS